jgi:D-serine deaminase-like pyridoxal phosphate-dependent protein
MNEMWDLATIQKPTVLLDEARARRNLARMAAKARRCGVRFRPHFKTHQSAEMGDWFRQQGVQAITVSSVDMAAYFADAGWKDILIAFSANLRQSRSIDELAGRIHLELLVESAETVGYLRDHLTHPVDLWIKADVGAHRTGIPVEEHAALVSLAHEIRGCGFGFKGLLTHAGHTYHPEGGVSIPQIYRQSVDGLIRARQALAAAGFPGTQLSYGDTPACTLVDDLSELDEIRPGNFIFYDLMQYALGVCSQEDIAVAVACPVVARHAEDGLYRLVFYGGAVHLSKEFLEVPGGRSYGGLAPITQDGWGSLLAGARVYALSQEHGLAVVSQEQYEAVQVGDLIAVVPVHSCLTVDLHDSYLTTTGTRIGIKQ